MKKTLTINLSGMIYHIDEDAYLLLDKYLRDVKVHLEKENDAREIINDIEGRISELFSEKTNQGSHVITIEHVDEVIKRIGQPKDFGESTDEKAKENQSQKNTFEPAGEGGNKKLYRNPDDKILGGVASGIAAYLDCDPTLVRLAFIICSIFWGTSILVYIILWMIVPLANTAAQKLEMRGEKINLENIGKTVTEGFEHMADDINTFVKSEKTRSGVQKVGDFLVNLVGICIKLFVAFFAVIAGIVLVFLVFILFVVIVALFMGGIQALSPYISDESFIIFSNNPNYILIAIMSIIFIIGIPLFSLVYLCLQHTIHVNPLNTTIKWVLFILWLAGIFMALSAFMHAEIPYGQFSQLMLN